MMRTLGTAAAVCLFTLLPGGESPPYRPDFVRSLSTRIPPRPASAATGTELYPRLRLLEGSPRDQVVLEELRRGNLPRFLRELKPVRLHGYDREIRRHDAVVWVMPDYLAVGSDDDFVRVPMGFEAAAAAARSFGFTLPTRKMVDAIYEQSSLRLQPHPLPPGPGMRTTAYAYRHHRIIERERQGRPTGELVAGHKKDLILTNLLLVRRDRVAIYGWHDSGRPIQPVSTFHGARYSDYSHGVRLVASTIAIDGRLRSIFDALGDPDLAPVLDDEGPIRDVKGILGWRLQLPETVLQQRKPR